uniref:poly(A)-specific ribonuclease n=1 Tax=Ditylenchus dipsaci TaxID=166011 RepID=A0A915DCW0_9BILA
MVAQEVKIHEVWCSNLEEEFVKIRSIIDSYPYVAMDTEFPGVVATPIGQFRSKEDFNYQQLLCNVNVLKLIQVGITLMDHEGRLPPTMTSGSLTSILVLEMIYIPQSPLSY